MRKTHRKQLLAWLLTTALLLANLPVSVLSEEIAENPIQAEATEQDEQGIAEEPIEPTEPPVSEEPDETPESGGQSETAEIPTDENNPDFPDQDKSETPVPEESPLPDDEEAFSVSEAILEYGYAYLVREHGETAGYVFEEITLDATVKSDETTDLSATNQPVMTRIRIKKRDKDEYAQTDAPSVRGDGELTGATFRVLAGADILDRQGNVIWLRGATVIDAIQTSGEDAAATTDELWPGLYEIVEIAPPVGYQPSDERMLVDTASAAAQSREAVVTYLQRGACARRVRAE